jgi:pyridoxine 5-phosphate synthase
MTQLSVNVNKVALLRNTRLGQVPSVTKAARLALDAGAYGITVHPRPDRRHIRPSDVDDLRLLLNQPAYVGREFNIEGNPFLGDYLEIVAKARPNQCTLVPDDPHAFTSDHGWDIPANLDRLKPIVQRLKDLGCRVSLFMDPDPDMIRRVPETGADRIELYTETYARAFETAGHQLIEVHRQFSLAAHQAQQLGLGINAGHDLNLHNLSKFLEIPGILEVSIGHALIADALEIGMPAAVHAYLQILKSPSR